MICETNSSAENDLKPYVDKLLKNQDDILYSFYFNIPSCVKCSSDKSTLPPNVFLACGPHFEIDYDLSIEQGKSIFNQIYPDDEFLPRAPDPDQIVFGEEADDNDDVQEVKEDDCEIVSEVKEDFLSDKITLSEQHEEAIEAKEDTENLTEKVADNLKIK